MAAMQSIIIVFVSRKKCFCFVIAFLSTNLFTSINNYSFCNKNKIDISPLCDQFSQILLHSSVNASRWYPKAQFLLSFSFHITKPLVAAVFTKKALIHFTLSHGGIFKFILSIHSWFNWEHLHRVFISLSFSDRLRISRDSVHKTFKSIIYCLHRLLKSRQGRGGFQEFEILLMSSDLVTFIVKCSHTLQSKVLPEVEKS